MRIVKGGHKGLPLQQQPWEETPQQQSMCMQKYKRSTTAKWSMNVRRRGRRWMCMVEKNGACTLHNLIKGQIDPSNQNTTSGGPASY